MNQRPNKILLTRRRWDAYMLPLFLAVTAIGIVRVLQTGQLRFALLPLALIPLWLGLRLQTPRDGILTPTVRSTPGVIVLFWSSGAAISLMMLLLAIDVYVLGNPFPSPLNTYHWLLFSPPFIIMFVGAIFADRIMKRQKRASDFVQKAALNEVAVNKSLDPREGSSGS
ncbi:hypothetical protein SH501x_002713 [Pirellulaceae bacterium SH501]